MSRLENTFWCDQCGVEIIWVPTILHGKHFCCRDCAEGFRCECMSRLEIEDERPHMLEDTSAEKKVTTSY